MCTTCRRRVLWSNATARTAFCEHYDVGLDVSANCVVVGAKRADVKGTVRKHVDARKISFAAMDAAVSLTGMQYGGSAEVLTITKIG